MNEYSDCVRVGIPTPFLCVRLYNHTFCLKVMGPAPK